MLYSRCAIVYTRDSKTWCFSSLFPPVGAGVMCDESAQPGIFYYNSAVCLRIKRINGKQCSVVNMGLGVVNSRGGSGHPDKRDISEGLR